jgi:hypothetical protein
VLGASLTRIFRALGHPVGGVNHLGDWGTQCGYQFLAWQKADPAERERRLDAEGLDYLADLYVEINAPAKRLKALENQLLEPKLAPEDRASNLREAQLSTPENTPKLGTLTELIDSLGACSPQRWTEKRDALRGQLTRALDMAAKILGPKVQPIAPPCRILRNEADLDAWLAEVRTAVIRKLPDGPVHL